MADLGAALWLGTKAGCAQTWDLMLRQYHTVLQGCFWGMRPQALHGNGTTRLIGRAGGMSW